MSSKQRRTPKPELTPDQQAYKDGLCILVNECAVVELRLADAKARCPHAIYRNGAWNYDPEDDSSGAVCAICGIGFGWWCPDSPDHACHYFTVGSPRASWCDDYLPDDDTAENQGKVKLLTGEFVTSPEHDPKYETDDRCLWCGQPNERK